jgi:hypothetical protein
MFSEMIADLQRLKMPEPVSLRKRFDFALTKKLGVLKLPSAFWTQDPKINPRSDHLLWAALLLMDRERIELALAVLEEEFAETSRTAGHSSISSIDRTIESIIKQLLEHIPEQKQRRKFRDDLRQVLPERLKI